MRFKKDDRVQLKAEAAERTGQPRRKATVRHTPQRGNDYMIVTFDGKTSKEQVLQSSYEHISKTTLGEAHFSTGETPMGEELGG
ncbi:MAG TPA: hypothetical protein VF521_11810 [Pyrinomonadaceae bacterium]|jgi:hypothetical protein